MNEQQRIEDLLKPRVEMIAPFPFCGKHNNLDDRPTIGDVFFVSENGSISKRSFTINDVAYYPHIFKPLQWWEKRSAEEMPEYVRHERGKSVYKIERWLIDAQIRNGLPIGITFDDPGINVYADEVYPVTNSSYTTFINTKK